MKLLNFINAYGITEYSGSVVYGKIYLEEYVK